MNAGRDQSEPEKPIPTDAYRPPVEGPGTKIGPYKLLQQIGEGGFGIVYMAEQDKPVHRRVALKIIKPGMDSAQVIARFEAERQALAMMDHQNIAKVYDAGTTDHGRPFFAMELVHGVPITRYCDDNHQTVRERLELFVPICKAIQHAHQKGIIHRDLKPSNVLVCLYDGQPVPKVIDFGVAKATEQRLTERTMFTQYGQMVGTFEYMSPEQAEMSQLGVDTRSDIYSLGVMLYELLTGSTPLERQRLRAAGLHEMLKIVKEEEPPKPSTRLSSTQDAPKIAAARRTEPIKLARLLRGELDWVVMKCLEKDRARRYDTANGLARDIERFLHDEPVEAGPPGAGYRLRKLARKHRAALGIAVLFAGFLLLAAAASLWQAVRATRAEGQALAERDRAEQEKDRAEASFKMARDTVDRFFTQVGESRELRSKGMEKFRRNLLLNAKDFYERLVREQGEAPEARHDLGLAYLRLAKIQVALGGNQEAEPLLDKAVAILEQLHREQPEVADYQRDLASGYAALGDTYRETGRQEDAEQLYQRALAMQTRLVEAYADVAQYRSALGHTYYLLGLMYRDSQRWERVLASYNQAQAAQAKLVEEHPKMGEYRWALARTQSALGLAYYHEGSLQKAEAALSDALKNNGRLVNDDPDSPEYQASLADTLLKLGLVHHAAAQYEEAEADFRRALQGYEKLAREHPDVLDYVGYVASAYESWGLAAKEQGNLELALASIDKAIEKLKQFLEREPRSPIGRNGLQGLRLNRAVILAMRGDHKQAVQEAEAVAASQELSSGNVYNLACLYSRSAAAASKDHSMPSTERTQLQNRYAGRAVETLRQAVAKGYRNLQLIRTDSDLEALRQREDFQKLVQEVEQKAKK